jgi:hypothetical protein
MNKLIGFVLGALIIFLYGMTDAVAAASYGRWYCDGCVVGDPKNVDTTNFIVATVNNKVAIWQVGDYASICDGYICADWVYVTQYSSFHWLPTKLTNKLSVTYPDTGKGYKNAPNFDKLSCYPTLYQAFTITMYVPTGNYYYWDYYSDGNYVGSSGLLFEITGSSPLQQTSYLYRPICA